MWLFSKDSTSAVGSLGLNFSSDPVPGFAFTISSDASRNESFVVAGPYGLQWRLRPVQRRKPVEDASIFTCALTSTVANTERELVLESLQKTVKWMKTLRHPNILNWVASTELMGSKLPTEFHIVTEKVIPLCEYLRLKADSGNFNFISSWGIHQISRALAFLNDDAKMAHNAVRMDAVFVTAAGEWKLGGLDFVGPVGEQPHSNRSTASFVRVTQSGDDPYLPPDNCLVDAWGLGCLIWEIFNPERTLRERGQLTATDALQRIPKSLVPEYRRLVASSGTRGAKKRFTVAQFLAQSRDTAKEGFFANQYVDTLLFLEEIQLKDAKEKLKFFSELTEQISSFPDDVCQHKILPHLLNGLRYGSAGIEALIPVLRIIPLLSESEFEAAVLPCLVQLFAAPERATRVRLLEQLPNFVQHLPSKVVETQIFPPVATGFSDANPLVREATVRAMIYLAPKLTGKLLNETLPRYLIGLQTKDEQGGIRTNATVCLAKLSSHFSTQVQQGVMLSAFLRVTRDPFAPCRRAAVAALAATQVHYTTEQLACKLLPCLSFLTLDPEKPIRDDAFRTIRGILELLEQISEDPSHGDVFLKDSQNTASNAKTSGSQIGLNAASTLGQWAFSALKFSSRLIASSGPTTSTTTGAVGSTAPSAESTGEKALRDQYATSETEATKPAPSKPASKPMNLSSRTPENDLFQVEDKPQDRWGVDDDDWGSLETDLPDLPAHMPSKPGVQTTAAWSRDSHQGQADKSAVDKDDFFDSILPSDSRMKQTQRSTTINNSQPSSKAVTPPLPTHRPVDQHDWNSNEFFNVVSKEETSRRTGIHEHSHEEKKSNVKRGAKRTTKKETTPPVTKPVDNSGWDAW